MMSRNYSLIENSPTSSSSTGLQHQQSTIISSHHDSSIRIDNNNDDEDKIDLKHISMALMKLLYPKVCNIFLFYIYHFHLKTKIFENKNQIHTCRNNQNKNVKLS